jgi:hypothetical protein
LDIFHVSAVLKWFQMANAIKVLLQKTTCHLQHNFFHIFEPNKGTKGPENHSLD